MLFKASILFFMFFRDMINIFVFYVLGDTITTHFALPYGYEVNSIPAMLLSTELGIYSILILKMMFFVWVWHMGKHFIKNKNLFAWNISKNFIILTGITLSVSNTFVIFTGLNLFQHIGLM